MSPPGEEGMRLLPNLGAEEGEQWRRFTDAPPVHETARLWRVLFGWPNTLVGPHDPQPEPDAWPPSLGEPPSTPVFEWLAAPDGITPWLCDEAARRWTEQQGASWAGPDPEAVGAVHDKAFAQQASESLGYQPRPLRGLVNAFDPRDLADADGFVSALRAALAEWPEWTGGQFTLKPRLGSSGRGRFGGEADAIDEAALRGALPRFAERGGVLLEPWLDRSHDLSVLLHLDPDPSALAPTVLLASLEQLVSASGVYQGHVGEVDARGRVYSGCEWDEPMREAAAALAGEARSRGYHGPCGVDGLVFRLKEAGTEPREVLRPLLELNARFTAGFVTLALVRRALPSVREALALTPSQRRAFLFSLDVPTGWSDWSEIERELGDQTRLLRLDSGEGSRASPLRPGLLFTRRLADLRAVLARSGEPSTS
jgi:hypothetical protein